MSELSMKYKEENLQCWKCLATKREKKFSIIHRDKIKKEKENQKKCAIIIHTTCGVL